MNRLVIIGNGFDLAHGLPTGYCDFINDYWISILSKFVIFSNKSNYEDELVNVIYEFDRRFTVIYDIVPEMKEIKNHKDFQAFIKKYSNENAPASYSNGCVIDFKNNFFKSICELHSINNWVDVENEYYRQLKRIALIKYNHLSEEESAKQKNEKVQKLNIEFDEVKSLLNNYLIKKVEETYSFSKDEVEDFLEIFKSNEYLDNNSLDRFFMEFSKKDEKQFEKDFEIKRQNESRMGVPVISRTKRGIKLKNNFLSFNYTSTVFEYITQLNLNIYNLIEIHGRLEDERNPINFGFGDEMDSHYQLLEETNDNEYLKNIKSFQYLHNSNYKRLLDLIDSDKFQVYIMGHSCGLSDRTLLNTIFEHENCISIKIFYHEILDEDGNYIKDNYTEITQNISRHFNKKKLMREKIVNKTLCQPLPQIQLPKKQNDPQS